MKGGWENDMNVLTTAPESNNPILSTIDVFESM